MINLGRWWKSAKRREAAQGSPQSCEETPNCCPLCGNNMFGDISDPRREARCPDCKRPFWFVRKTMGETVILTFLPKLISTNEISLRGRDELLAAAGDATGVVLNLVHLRIVSSMFLGMVVAMRATLAEAGKRLKLCGLSSEVLAVFTTARLHTVLDISDNEQSALESFG
ncbi:MAG: STAS domain-containing protein [Thermoguttaceae bacterium]